MGEPVRGRGSYVPDLAPNWLFPKDWATFPMRGMVPYTRYLFKRNESMCLYKACTNIFTAALSVKAKPRNNRNIYQQVNEYTNWYIHAIDTNQR